MPEQIDPARRADLPTTATEVTAALNWWHDTYHTAFSPHRALVDLQQAAAEVAALRKQVQRVKELAGPEFTPACPILCGACAEGQCDGEGLRRYVPSSAILAVIDGNQPMLEPRR